MRPSLPFSLISQNVRWYGQDMRAANAVPPLFAVAQHVAGRPDDRLGISHLPGKLTAISFFLFSVRADLWPQGGAKWKEIAPGKT